MTLKTKIIHIFDHAIIWHFRCWRWRLKYCFSLVKIWSYRKKVIFSQIATNTVRSNTLRDKKSENCFTENTMHTVGLVWFIRIHLWTILNVQNVVFYNRTLRRIPEFELNLGCCFSPDVSYPVLLSKRSDLSSRQSPTESIALYESIYSRVLRPSKRHLPSQRQSVFPLGRAARSINANTRFALRVKHSALRKYSQRANSRRRFLVDSLNFFCNNVVNHEKTCCAPNERRLLGRR